jgi:hypothetical protein
MKYIEEQLGSIGPVNFIAYRHDNTNGKEGITKFTSEVTNVRANVALCLISFHWRETVDGKVLQDADPGVELKVVEQVVVVTQAVNLRDITSKAGRPELAVRVDPPVFALLAKRKAGLNAFVLYDESQANRIAKAMVHAAELCGGGDKDPFK